MIKAKINRITNYIMSREDDLSLEHRLVLSALTIGICIGLLGFVTNYFLTTSIIASMVPVLLAIIASILYYFARFKKIYGIISILTAIFGILGFSVLWVFNGGIDGPNMMLSLVFLVFWIIIVSEKAKKYILILFIGVNVFILLIQLYRPDLIVTYPTEIDRWIDSLIGVIYSSICIFLIIRFIHNNYTFKKRQLEVSEQLYRNLFDQANEGLILLTMDGKIAELNQSFAQMHGYTVDEMKNMDIKDLDVLRVGAFDGRAAVMQGIYNGEVVRFEVEHFHKNGHSFILSDTVSLITIAGKQYFLAFHQDITERKQAEEKLKYSESTLRESQKIAGLGTFDLDIPSGIFRTSDILNEIFGIHEKYDHSISGWAALIHPEDREMIVNYLMIEVIGRMQPGNIEFRIVRYNDKITRWMHIMAKIELAANGHPSMVHGTALDITDRKQAEQELIIAKEKAEESDKLKTAFLANMSHEIRTPMNGIIGFLDLLSEPGITGEEKKESIDLIQQSGKRMLNTLHEIVEISRIESGQTIIHFQKTNINEKLENVYKLLKPDAENKRLILSFKNGLPAEEAFTVTDKDKLYAILTNLVKNAIKYTDTGSIEFGYSIIDTRHNLSLLQFYVKDTGIGILKDRQEAIFERFVQSDIADIQGRQGVGLGLSIAKAYVNMLGGRIWVESEQGKGSTFYFTLPYNTEPEE